MLLTECGVRQESHRWFWLLKLINDKTKSNTSEDYNEMSCRRGGVDEILRHDLCVINPATVSKRVLQYLIPWPIYQWLP